ncbi:MAG: DUF1805 domain-containing protein [Elusimicrobia bacterium]|nr:DUF1805 domain-containing protein [Elusimicrobiota bacterium]
MQTHEIVIGNKKGEGIEIPLPGAPLVLAKGSLGFVMCGYLDLHTADKVKAPAAIVRGVKTVDELLAAPVVAVSAAATDRGVKPGMTGYEALELFL